MKKFKKQGNAKIKNQNHNRKNKDSQIFLVKDLIHNNKRKMIK